MIRVTVTRSCAGHINKLSIKGHAGYADSGQDIVCAGASAVAQTCVIGLKKVAGVDPLVTLKNGFFALALPEGISAKSADRALCILETAYLGLKDMALSYPSNIRVRTIKEVL